MTSWSTSRLVAVTLCSTRVRDRAINNGANAKPSSSLSEPPLEIEMIDVSAALAVPPCAGGICHPSASPLRPSFAGGGGNGWYRDGRRRGDVWDGGRDELTC